jgi:cysteinyl-tRNA synthetase
VGPGRPGWHIECSAMALRLLGPAPIDLHAGGVDLIFPHHENEIAQAEGATKQQFARFWYHVEHLLMDDGEKMSKSLGNVFTVKDILDQGYRASALRYLLLSVHYRKQLKFSWTSLTQCEEALKRLMDFLARLDLVAGDDAHPALVEKVTAARQSFGEMMLSDVNAPGALGVMFDLVRTLNAAIDAGEVGKSDVAAIREAFDHFDRVLGIIALRRAEEAAPPVPVDEIERLIEERREARRKRDFARADQIRQELDARGILLEDSPAGTRWKRK